MRRAWSALRELAVRLAHRVSRLRGRRSLPAPVRPAPPGAFTAARTGRPPVSLGESPTSAAEKPRTGPDAARHVGEQALAGTARAQLLVRTMQHAPTGEPDPARRPGAGGPPVRIPRGPLKP